MFTVKRGDIISSMSKTYLKYWTPWLVGRCREAWYTLSLSTARPHLTDPCGVFACGCLLRRGIVTNRTKSLRRLVGDRLICHFGGERSCGVLSASSRWRISSVVEDLALVLPYESSLNPLNWDSMLCRAFSLLQEGQNKTFANANMSTPTQESPVTAAPGRMESPPKQSLRELPDWGPLSAPHLAPSLTHNTPCQRSICSGVEVAAGSQPPASSLSHGTVCTTHKRWLT